MKVYIGPYKEWWGVYQLADLLKKVNVSQNRCEEIGDKLVDSWIDTFCEWIHSKRNRKIRVRIDCSDTWSMDSTLSYIIVPMLKQLKKVGAGAPWVVDDNDVPDHLKSTNASAVEEWEMDDYHFKRWDWVLDEMIWAFEQVNTSDELANELITGWKIDDVEEHIRNRHAAEDRMNRGFILLGKYYSSLWD